MTTAKSIVKEQQRQWQWPQDPAFGRVLPKSKIYDKASPSKKQKALFVAQVERIIHTSILAPSKVNLPAKNGYNEIHVFTVELRENHFNTEILRVIDKVVPYPTLFILSLPGQLRYVAAFKRPSEADKNKWVTSDYFQSAWIPDSADKEPLPLALDLQSLYHQLIQRLMPFHVRTKEDMGEFVDRAERIQHLQDQAQKLDQKSKNQKIQYNRRVEFHTELQALNQEIQRLKDEL